MFGQVFGSSDRAWDDIVQGLHCQSLVSDTNKAGSLTLLVLRAAQ